MIARAAYIRATHPYAFRSGDWARLLATLEDPETGRKQHLVEFPDGVSDFWPADDEAAGYEYRAEVIL